MACGLLFLRIVRSLLSVICSGGELRVVHRSEGDYPKVRSRDSLDGVGRAGGRSRRLGLARRDLLGRDAVAVLRMWGAQ